MSLPFVVIAHRTQSRVYDGQFMTWAMLTRNEPQTDRRSRLLDPLTDEQRAYVEVAKDTFLEGRQAPLMGLKKRRSKKRAVRW